jgi:hypothetical protein
MLNLCLSWPRTRPHHSRSDRRPAVLILEANISSAKNGEQIRLERRTTLYWRVTFDHPPLNIFGPETIGVLGAQSQAPLKPHGEKRHLSL